MKKRIFSLFLVFCILSSLMVFPAGAAEPVENMVTQAEEICPCGCGKTLDAVTWKPWAVNGIDGPTSGHYYLDGDYVQDGQKEIMAGDRVVLDLRGNTITTKSYSRIALVYGRMHIMDTVGGGRLMSKVSGAAYGGVFMVATNEVNDSMLELCSGTITIDEDNKGSRRGGIIQVSATATFRMTGGLLLNGTTVNAKTPDTKEPGGCIAAITSTCTVEILGGTIAGGESSTHGGNIYSVGTTILKNCTIIGGTAAKSGGNVCQNTGSLTVENCVIKDGIANEAGNGGGNICVMSGAKFSIKDSTVRNGWTRWSGGNIFLGTCETVIENTIIEAGVARNRGNNIYGSPSASKLVIRDCDIPGDVGYIGKGLVLEGKVKIGLLNHGLRLCYGDTCAEPLQAAGLADGSEVFVVAKHTFAAPGADIAKFKGAIRTVIAQSEEGLTATYAENGALGGYCPHCNQQVAWKLFDTSASLIQSCLKDSATDTNSACTGRHIESGHYYLGKTHTGFAQYYVGIYQDLADIKDVVIDLAGYSISATGRAFYIRGTTQNPQQSSLTMLDSYGASNVYGKGAGNQPGGVVYNESSNFTIYGGTYIYNPDEVSKNVTGGGVVLNGNSFKMYGGTLDGSAFTYTDQSTADKTYTYYGGCLYQYNGTQYDFTMTAGRMIGGYAQAGGCAYFGGNNKVDITGGQFTDGKANGGGGNIRMYGSDSYTKAEFTMSGAAVRDGRVEITGAGGGNLGIHYGKVNISDSYIEGGYATAYGGNIMVGIKVTMTVTDTIVEGGYAAAQSGNVHLSSTNSYTTWDNCTVLNGSGTYGGNMTSGNGYNTFRGGSYLFGTARTSYGGNFAANAGNVSATSTNYTLLEADDEGNAPLLAGGYAKTYGGNLYNGGVTNIQAARMINGSVGTSGKDLYMAMATKQGKLTIGAGVTGTIYARFNKDLYTGEVYGQAIDRTVCEELNANIIIDNYNNALLCAKEGKLHLGAFAVTDGENYQWFTDTASAVAACDENSYVRLFVAQDVVLTKDCAVDICGQTINVSGPYTLYGMDSSGDDYTAPTGKVVLAEETTLASSASVCGKQYIASRNAQEATFHRLENRITNVTLRPSADGIYYTGSFGCDATLTSDIASYGVAVSLVNAPGADFMTDSDTLYTNFEGASLQGGANVTGTLISGIMKQENNAKLNSAYGQMPIFAASYLMMNDGTVVLSDSVALSLQDVMKTVDTLIDSDPLHFRKLTNPMRAFYDKWEENGMADWNFKKIITPKEDDVIDILMVGNSFCYYYVEELAGIAAAAGVKMRVCNLYYSGCKMSQHYNWWTKGEAPYQFFDTTAEGGRKQTNNVSLEWALAQGEWDYISIQSLNIDSSDPVELMAANKLYLDTFYGYFREQFPKAKLMYHQTWSYAVGTAGNGTVTTPEKQAANHQRNHDVARLICKEYGLDGNIPTGDAWALIRAEGYDKLCARIGKGTNHEGDYYHDGDVGGGQYLNAAVWFEAITGQSVIGNTYRPVYKYNGTEIPLNSEMTYEKLQAAAHQAMQDMLNEEEVQ